MEISKNTNIGIYKKLLIGELPKIGTVLPESEIYQYVESLHNDEDFIDGDIGDRIEEFPKYTLMEINISSLDLEEWELDICVAEEYSEVFKNTGYSPPIVVSDECSIIDGLHRANSVNLCGKKSILAFVGKY